MSEQQFVDCDTTVCDCMLSVFAEKNDTAQVRRAHGQVALWVSLVVASADLKTGTTDSEQALSFASSQRPAPVAIASRLSNGATGVRTATCKTNPDRGDPTVCFGNECGTDCWRKEVRGAATETCRVASDSGARRMVRAYVASRLDLHRFPLSVWISIRDVLHLQARHHLRRLRPLLRFFGPGFQRRPRWWCKLRKCSGSDSRLRMNVEIELRFIEQRCPGRQRPEQHFLPELHHALLFF